mmetsp:Transcript_23912/g.27547  ORF Transcript_23912/g.27547 Transcript_23912/m.27547 type:complete len:218 (+) Transcript_23912:216-869(+)
MYYLKRISKRGDLYHLVERKEWGSLIEQLSSKHGKKVVSSDQYVKDDFLLKVCQYQPPTSALSMIVALHRKCLHQIDSDGRTALHVAVENMSSVDAINFLVGQFPEAAALKDRFGRTPLTLVCEIFNKIESRHFQNLSNNIYISRVCEILCNAAPQCVIEEDEHGMNPIEIAIINEVDFSIVRKLQRCAMKERRRIAKKNERYWEENQHKIGFCPAA